jgi:hypothetical protein
VSAATKSAPGPLRDLISRASALHSITAPVCAADNFTAVATPELNDILPIISGVDRKPVLLLPHVKLERKKRFTHLREHTLCLLIISKERLVEKAARSADFKPPLCHLDKSRAFENKNKRKLDASIRRLFTF